MRRLAILAAALLALGGVACSSDSGGSGGGAPFEVSGEPVATTNVDLPRSYKFVPAAIRIHVGDTVTWTNHDNFPHSVKLLDGSDVLKQLPVGTSTTITFEDAGTIYYECSIHPSQMHGKVVVEG